MVDATEYLLERQSIDNVSVAEVVRRAGSSVGSFYARFPDKHALIDYIDEVYGRRAVANWEAFLDQQRAAGKPLFEAIHAIVELMVVAHRRKCGLARAIYLYVRTSRSPSAVVARAESINGTIAQMMVDFVLEHRRELRSQHPERAIRTALLSTVGAIREAILFGNLQLHSTVSDDDLVDELANAFWNHIHTPLRRTHG